MRKIDKIDISYYGRLYTPLLRGTIGHYLMDELFKKIIERNNAVLEENQSRLLSSLSRQIKDILNKFERDIYKIKDALNTKKKISKNEKVLIKLK
jgi:hypothetical protein